MFYLKSNDEPYKGNTMTFNSLLELVTYVDENDNLDPTNFYVTKAGVSGSIELDSIYTAMMWGVLKPNV